MGDAADDAIEAALGGYWDEDAFLFSARTRRRTRGRAAALARAKAPASPEDFEDLTTDVVPK
jgi:hypothetical protein